MESPMIIWNNGVEGEDMDRALSNYNSFIEDMAYFMDDPEGNEDLGPFTEYGLCFDYTGEYYRFQMSYGGPSTEVRFYRFRAVEYVYLNWGIGIGFALSKDVAEWLVDWFDSYEAFRYAKDEYNKDLKG